MDVNINLSSFYDISHNRTYNKGSVYIHDNLFGGQSLYRANYHHYLPNITDLTPEQNLKVRQAFAAALERESGIPARLLDEIRTRLGLGGGSATVSSQPLERREIKAIFDLMEARGALQGCFLPSDDGRSKARRMLDANISHQFGISLPPRLGHPVFDHAMRNMAISRLYDTMLGEMSGHPRPTVDEERLRAKVFEEYDRVWQEFHQALSECEPKGVYRHLAILGLQDDPADNPDELRNALKILDDLEKQIPNLAEMDDAAAAKAIYEKLCERRTKQPDPTLDTLSHTQEIRDFLAEDAKNVKESNENWIDLNWKEGVNFEEKINGELKNLECGEDMIGTFIGEVNTRLKACPDDLSAMNEKDLNSFFKECIRKGGERVKEETAERAARAQATLNREQNLRIVQDDPRLRPDTKEALATALKDFGIVKLGGIAAAVISLSRLDFSQELTAFRQKDGGIGKDDIRDLALAMSRKVCEKLKADYPDLAPRADVISSCVMTVLAMENEDFQLAVAGMNRSDMTELGALFGFCDSDGRNIDDLDTLYSEKCAEFNSVLMSDDRRETLDTEIRELKDKIDTLKIGYHFVQNFDGQLDDIQERLLERNPAAKIMTEELTEQLFGILLVGDGTQQPEESMERVRSNIGKNVDEIRSTVRSRFFRSPKLRQLVVNLANENLDPEKVKEFKDKLSLDLQDYGKKSIFGGSGLVHEFFRVRCANGGGMFDLLNVGGKRIPAKPRDPEAVSKAMPKQMLDVIRNVTVCNKSLKSGQAAYDRCLAFVEAMFDEGVSLGDLVATCTLLGLNGLQMSFNDLNMSYALKTGEEPAITFMDQASDKNFGFNASGPAEEPKVPADIIVDKDTKRVKISAKVVRGFSVVKLGGCNAVTGTAATSKKIGMVEAFNVVVELHDTHKTVDVPVGNTEESIKLDIPKIEVTTIEKV